MFLSSRPIDAAPVTRHARPAHRRTGRDERKPLNHRPRVLVVEDDYLVATGIESALVEAGCEVVGMAMSAEGAVRLAKEQLPDVTVMDIRLSGERDGIDAALEIYATTGIRCIFATAHDDPDMRARAKAAAPLGWVPKPYAVETIVTLVKALHRGPDRRT